MALLVLASLTTKADQLSLQQLRAADIAAILELYQNHAVDAPGVDRSRLAALAGERAARAELYSVALSERYQSPLGEQGLREELERIARRTQFPTRLQEIFARLDQDSTRVIEALVRPELAERLLHDRYDQDPELHRAEREQADRLRAAVVSGEIDPSQDHALRNLVLMVPEHRERSRPTEQEQSALPTVELPRETFETRRRWLERGERIGAIEQNKEAFSFAVTLEASPQQILIARYRVPKRPFESWWQEFSPSLDRRRFEPIAATGEPLPLISSTPPDTSSTLSASGCGLDDRWVNGSFDDLPVGREQHSAIWTGFHLFIWGGLVSYTTSYDIFNDGARYDPVTDSWLIISRLGAPSPRYGHRAVWSGTRMLVWGGIGPIAGAPGGYGQLGDGGIYDPFNDVWSPISTANAPSPRSGFTAIWTGSRMLVWGGFDGSAFRSDGGSFDPTANVWSPISNIDPPSARHGHTAVWAPSSKRMVIWGGEGDLGLLDTGGVYTVTTDSWRPTANTGHPRARFLHSAVWTGSEMIIWGGYGVRPGDPLPEVLNTGARYNPASGSWTGPTNEVGSPVSRANHTGIWTGTKMIIWGGEDTAGPLGSGGVYDPIANSWVPISNVGAASPRSKHSSAWTGSEMIIWGGYGIQPWGFPGWVATGARYRLATDSWTPMNSGSAPDGRLGQTTVWSGNEMLIWSGHLEGNWYSGGGRYDPLLDAWLPLSTFQAPAARLGTASAWTGTGMLVWGGTNYTSRFGDGAIYSPLSDSWAAINAAGAPTPRDRFSSAWSGSELIVFGGELDNTAYNDGARYSPSLDRWQSISTLNAPEPRADHAAVWSGDRMLVWGGRKIGIYLNSGGSYDPLADSWSALSTSGTPEARAHHQMAWTGRAMLVWGGHTSTQWIIPTGGRYYPESDSWLPIDPTNSPGGREDHTAVWTGTRWVIWSGSGDYFNSAGGQYDPIGDRWTPMTEVGAPLRRFGQSSVWANGRVLIWGGASNTYHRDGGRYGVDADGDGAGDSCDCAPLDGGSTAAPGEVEQLRFDLAGTLQWVNAAVASGSGTRHDLARGPVGSLPNFDAGGVCLASATAASSFHDSANPGAGDANWYLVRAKNGCGVGGYGQGSSGAPRSIGACP